MLAEFDRALAAAVDDPKCGAIVLSGAGRAFCAGHDLGTEEEIRYCQEHNLPVPHDGNLSKKVADMHVWFVRKTLEWRNCPKPAVIAFMLNFIWGSIAAFSPLYALHHGVLNPGIFFVFLAATLIVGRSLGGKILDVYDRQKVAAFCLSIIIIGLIILPFANNFRMFVLIAVL